MSIVFDPSPDLARQVRSALEDEAAQPLNEVQRRAPEGCDYFSELEASIGEWSFGYGVAWALARTSDPMLPSSAAARIAEAAVNDAWRLFSDQGWTALMAEDRAQRGPVAGDEPPAEDVALAEEPQAPAVPEPEPEDSTDLGQFMAMVGRSRARRQQQRGTGTDG